MKESFRRIAQKRERVSVLQEMTGKLEAKMTRDEGIVFTTIAAKIDIVSMEYNVFRAIARMRHLDNCCPRRFLGMQKKSW